MKYQNCNTRTRNTQFVPFSKLVDDFFNDLIPSTPTVRNVARPKANIAETDELFRIELLVPGFVKEDFEIQLEESVLTVSTTIIETPKADTEETTETPTEKYTRREFRPNSLKRSFNLPETADAESITATYENGILSIHIPKKELEQPAKKVIEIK